MVSEKKKYLLPSVHRAIVSALPGEAWCGEKGLGESRKLLMPFPDCLLVPGLNSQHPYPLKNCTIHSCACEIPFIELLHCAEAGLALYMHYLIVFRDSKSAINWKLFDLLKSGHHCDFSYQSFHSIIQQVLLNTYYGPRIVLDTV